MGLVTTHTARCEISCGTTPRGALGAPNAGGTHHLDAVRPILEDIETGMCRVTNVADVRVGRWMAPPFSAGGASHVGVALSAMEVDVAASAELPHS